MEPTDSLSMLTSEAGNHLKVILEILDVQRELVRALHIARIALGCFPGQEPALKDINDAIAKAEMPKQGEDNEQKNHGRR